MGATVSTGPSVSAGPMLGANGAPDTVSYAGPGLDYQGSAFLDPRYPLLGAAEKIGWANAHADSPYPLLTDSTPAASAAVPVNIAAAANTVSGTAMTLAGATSGITPAIPFYSFSSNALITSGVTLDFGFGAAATTSGSGTITPVAATMKFYSQGQWIVIGNCGNAGGTIPLITQVQSVGASTVVVLPAPLATVAAAPVGSGNILDLTSGASATAWQPRIAGGLAAMFNPLEATTRGVGINCSAAAGGGVFTVRGYDIYGQAMSETITHPGGNVTAYGKKAFKHIMSVTPGFTDGTRTYSVGTSDVFGFNLRSDRWEYLNLYVAGSFLSASTGWTAGDTTSPATSTTGDVRGTIQVGTRGSLGSGAAGGPITGSQAIAFFMTVPLYNQVSATPANPAPLYGVTQA